MCVRNFFASDLLWAARDGWILRPFEQYSVILGKRVGDNIRLCAVEPRLRLKRSSPQTGLELGTEGGNETGRIASPENEISSLKKKHLG